MNPAAILALISDLCTQIGVLRQENERLRGELQQATARATES
ncbi:MAG: hypothetical protein ACLP01_16695 [Solirubrobacteraceae bacterium]